MLRELTKTRIGIAYGIALLLASASFLALVVFGAVVKDMAGAVAVGVMVSGMTVNVAIVLSYWLAPPSTRVAGALWLFLAVAGLIAMLVQVRAGISDADIVMGYVIAALSFPIGLLVEPIALAIRGSRDAGGMAVYWIVGVVAGLGQWFVIVPRLVISMRKAG